MKLKSILCLALALASTTLLPSCSTVPAERKQQLATLANTALNYAELSGQINPKQAALIRNAGALVLKASDGEQIDLQAISTIAVDAAVTEGKLTPEQAEQLLAAGTVALDTATPSNPLLPPGSP